MGTLIPVFLSATIWILLFSKYRGMLMCSLIVGLKENIFSTHTSCVGLINGSFENLTLSLQLKSERHGKREREERKREGVGWNSSESTRLCWAVFSWAIRGPILSCVEFFHELLPVGLNKGRETLPLKCGSTKSTCKLRST